MSLLLTSHRPLVLTPSRSAGGEARAATTTSSGVGILEFESSAYQVVREFQNGSAKVFGGLGVADNLDAFRLCTQIDLRRLGVEPDYVFESRTAAAFDPKAQKDSFATILGDQLLQPCNGFRGDDDRKFGVDHECTFSFGGVTKNSTLDCLMRSANVIRLTTESIAVWTSSHKSRTLQPTEWEQTS